MTQEGILSDELLRQLMAVGQVDILVGVPTLNNAATVAGVVSAAHASFARHFPRERAVLINSDGGSGDGTPEIARAATVGDAETLSASHPLRTIHRVSAPYHRLPGRAGALRTILAAADLLRARAVAVLDPDLAEVAPERVAALIQPVYRDGLDFLAPIQRRHPLEAPLLSQLVRPLVRAAYARRLHDPLAVEFGCSGRFAAACLEDDVWGSDLAQFGVDLWLLGSALAGEFRCGQVRLGRHATAASAKPLPGLPELFRQVVGSLFGCLERHAPRWLERAVVEPLPTYGAADGEPPRAREAAAGGGRASGAPRVAAPLDPGPMAESFRAGLRSLTPILAEILAPDTLHKLRALVEADGAVDYPDELWALTVFDFAAAYRHGGMHRDHLTQALVPLYLGRTASFVAASASADPGAMEEGLEALCLSYERLRNVLVDRWRREKERKPWSA